MGRRSKATLARLNNFSKPINPQNPTVEEVLDDEGTHFEDEDFLEHGFFFLDEGQPGEDSDGADSDEEEVAVVVGYYSHSPISRTKSLTWRNTSLLGVTSVISIPSITAS